MHCFCMLLQWITWQTVPLPIWIRHTQLEFSVSPSASCIVSGCHAPPCHHTVLPTRTCHIMSVSRSALCLVLCETQPYNCTRNWCSYLDALHATAALELLDCFPQSLRFYRDPWHNLCPNNYAQTHARKNASITSRHIARAGSCQEDMSAYTLVLFFIGFLCLAITRLYSLAQARLALQVFSSWSAVSTSSIPIYIWVILPVLHGKKRMLLPIDSSQLPGLLKQHFLAQDCCNLGQTKQSLIDGQRALEANVANECGY